MPDWLDLDLIERYDQETIFRIKELIDRRIAAGFQMKMPIDGLISQDVDLNERLEDGDLRYKPVQLYRKIFSDVTLEHHSLPYKRMGRIKVTVKVNGRVFVDRAKLLRLK